MRHDSENLSDSHHENHQKLSAPIAPGHPAGYEDEPPPILGTWPRFYAAIVGYLVTLITLFYLFTRAYRITS